MAGQHQGYALYDLHCHLDFFADPAQAALELEALGVAALSATVTPCGFERARCDFAGTPNVRVGAGLHPWWVADGTCGQADIDRAAQLAAESHFIAEVGLDFARGRDAAAQAQLHALDRILAACERGDRVLSIHAVRSAGTVLDLLERYGTARNNTAILHWFSGTGDELTRAVRMGCRFSVGPRMLATKRGRAYARQIPPGQLLLETDLPSSADEGVRLTPAVLKDALVQALDGLVMLHGDDTPERIAAHSAEILGI